MRILVVGAGALGGLVGAQLTEAGEDVLLLEIDEKRADLLNREGLYITEEGKGERKISVRVITTMEGIDPVDLVFVSVKTYQTEVAVKGVLPVIGDDTRVLSMQNGIGNTDVMVGILGREKVLSGITYHSIQHTGPNKLRYRVGIKPIQIASCEGKSGPDVEKIGEVFRKAGLKTDVVRNIDHVIWQKLLHNAVVNPVSALTGQNCNQLLEDQDLQALMREVCMEIIAVMRARGVPIINKDDPYAPVIDSQKALGENRPSMWQDLDRGLKTEVDALNGAIVAEAERHGLKAPLNWMLVRLVHSAERRNQNKESGE
jgi:2-dehydropantoate 2-reductase